MKDSGVEWIGEIPREWRVVKLKKIAKIQTGNTPSKVIDDVKYYCNKDENDGFLWVKPNDLNGFKFITDSIEKLTKEGKEVARIAPENSILVCCIGSIGKFGIINSEVAFNQQINCVTFSSEIFFKYGVYLISSSESQHWLYSNGNVVKILNNEGQGKIICPIPPLEEQEKIANYLDKKVSDINLIIEKTRATIEDYKKYKQSIITEAVTKGINPNVEMKDSGIEWIGEIPREWEVRKLKTFLSTISKGTTPKEISLFKNEKYQVRYIKSENIVNNIVINIPEFFISVKTHEELKRSQLEENDILIVIAGAGIGKTAILPKSLLPCNTNQAISFLRLNKNFYYKKYIWYVLQSDILKSFILLYSVQSAQPNLSMENLENLKIAISTQEQEIEKIINYLDKKTTEIDTLITKKEVLIAELEEYKKSLIYECVTGKKEIK